MTRQTYSMFVVATAVSASMISTSAFARDQILEIHSDSLTTYLPTANSNVQGIRPVASHRGVNVDGSLRLSSSHRLALAGNPFPQRWNSNQVLAGVRLDNGTYIINDVDLAYPADVPWVIGRSYNSRQHDTQGYVTSDGYQGTNWFQSSQPELVFYDSQTDSEDTIYLIYGADRFFELRRADDQGQGDSTDTFRAVNGAAGAILLGETGGVGTTYDIATYYDQRGNQMVFWWFGDSDTDDDIEGSIWKVVDPAGNTAYVGSLTASTALSVGYDGDTGAILKAYDSAGRRFTYTYIEDAQDPNDGRLEKVTAEVYDSSWEEVGIVKYEYYEDADSHGEDHDLMYVRTLTPLSDTTSPLESSSIVQERTKYYRYYGDDSYNATTHPGHEGQVKMILAPEGTRRYDYADDATFNDSFDSASDNDLKSYASAYFKYDEDRRIVTFWSDGACGCSGSANGEHTIEYESNGSFSGSSGYDTDWTARTIVRLPDVTYETSAGAIKAYVTQYFDETGQPLHRVHTDDDPDNTGYDLWATKVVRNSDGQITDIHSPANVTGYTHSTASFTTSGGTGLVTVFTQIASDVYKGFTEFVKHKEGTTETARFDRKFVYYGHTNDPNNTDPRTLLVGDAQTEVTRPFIVAERVYPSEGTSDSGYEETEYLFDTENEQHDPFHSMTSTNVMYLAPKEIKTSLPAVSTGNNGSGSSTYTIRYVRAEGTTAFVRELDGTYAYTEHEDGNVIKRIEDAKTSDNSAYANGDDPSSDFGITETNDGWHRVTTTGYSTKDGPGITTTPDGRVGARYSSQLADRRIVALQYTDFDVVANPDEYYGPIQYTVLNHADQVEAEGIIGLTNDVTTTGQAYHIEESASDIIDAVGVGTLVLLSESVFDNAGTVLEESRHYTDIGADVANSSYDTTKYGYDDQGRVYRVEAPHGTITRTDYDTLGRAVRRWTGTVDSDFDGGATGTDDMVKTMELEYDSGGDKGNGNVTKQTAFVEESTTDKRETTFEHDVRGRVMVRANPDSPHHLNKYDNLGRLVAQGLYSSGSLDAATDPTTETTDRIGLTQIFYDELGRAWKLQRHKIDDADGSDDDNLQTLTWFDAAGRVIKEDGELLTKEAYDRLGRHTHSFVLSSDNDSAYNDADDVTGDIVLEESQTVYESSDSDDVVMTAVIERFHDDYGVGEHTGALDTNADDDSLKLTATNINGRILMTAMWYDRFGRITDSVFYGQYDTDSDGDFDDFDRDGFGSAPARADTRLVTEYEYGTNGQLEAVIDPRNLKTTYGYDDGGRAEYVIRNYVDDSPSGPNGDDDVFTRYSYTDGLLTEIWADIDGDGNQDADDQITTYTYGTTKGTGAGDSKIGTGHLLQKVQYPDSAGGTDVVTYAYNAQSQQMWTKDQSGNIIETDFDTSGRVTHKRVTTIDGDFDNAVLRISTTYNDLGRPSTITQYDNATVGSGAVVDEVKYTYEDWGNVSKFEQDHNSAVATGGSYLYDVDYTYAKATTGRNTVRRSMLDLPDGTDVSFIYSQSSALHDDEASRVTKINVGSLIPVTTATYSYNGSGSVVGITYNEPDVMWEMFSSTSGLYPDLDRFNRVVSSRWTKDLATDVDFYDVDITYDRNGNIVLTVDNVYDDLGGTPKNLFDVDYTIDNLDRLTQAEEGHWTGSAIEAGTETRDQQWTLDQVGNWDVVKLDLDGNGTFSGTNEYNDDRTHNDVNELTARDTDDNGTDNYTLTYDEVGQLTDDGEFYTYVYDAFGRLRQVKNRSTSALVVEHWYNGLGYRIVTHYDTDSDDDVDANDTKFHFVYDDRWRIVAMYEDDDSDPTEQFVYHNAGAGGFGGSSYIDSVVLRDRDTTGNGTLDERVYYCQNWRSDVVALVTDDGKLAEQVRYSAYGVPYGLPKGDTNGDGDTDSTDTTQIQSWIDAPSYDVRGDLDLDGDVDSTDKTDAQNNSSASGGWKVLTNVDNRKAYAGYEIDPAILANYGMYHVRSRALNSDLGRWTSRDPLGSIDGMNLYAYARGGPIALVDPQGAKATAPGYGWRVQDLMTGSGNCTPCDNSCARHSCICEWSTGACCCVEGGGGSGCGLGSGGGELGQGGAGPYRLFGGGGGVPGGSQSARQPAQIGPSISVDICRQRCGSVYPGKGQWGEYAACMAGCVNVQRGFPAKKYCKRFKGKARRAACLYGTTIPFVVPRKKAFPWGTTGWDVGDCENYCDKEFAKEWAKAQSEEDMARAYANLRACQLECQLADCDPEEIPSDFDPWPVGEQF